MQRKQTASRHNTNGARSSSDARATDRSGDHPPQVHHPQYHTGRVTPPPVFWLGHALELRKVAEGSCSALARKISEANGIKPRAGAPVREIVDRRKIQAMIDRYHGVTRPQAPKLVLTYEELVALDCYLELHKMGLARNPVFERPEVLQLLTDVDRATLVVASRPREHHLDVSHWDVEALATIQRVADRITPGCRFDIQNVQRCKTMAEVKKTLNNPWLEELLGDDGPAVVCIGSPRASDVAEAMLARMFGLAPFKTAPATAPMLPFHFIWSDSDGHDVPSCVALELDAAQRIDSGLAREVGKDRSWAFELRERLLPARFPVRGKDPTTTYGVVVVQRQRNGRPWFVIAGLSGAGTLAAAQATSKIVSRLPETRLGEVSRVQWAVVEAMVELDPGRSSSIPRIVNWRILAEPELWPPLGRPLPDEPAEAAIA
ncbi:MAG: hypothetical protein PVF43_15795 [Candidatus Eiseniibacteriota bacterium]